MKNKILFPLLLLIPLAAWAEVNFISVTGTDYFTREKDFNSTYHINIQPLEITNAQKTFLPATKCQAIKIHPKWFLTAAHCVDKCADASSCDIDIVLYEDNTHRILYRMGSTQKNKKVFYFPDFKIMTDTPDIALFKFNPASQNIQIVSKAHNAFIPYSLFKATRKDAQKAMQKAIARKNFNQDIPLAYFDDSYMRFNRILSFIFIQNGIKKVLTASDYEEDPDSLQNPVYFLKQTRILIVSHFGSVPGTSGAGIMTNSGELAGINSFHGEAELYREKIKKTFSGFATINSKSLPFIKNIMGTDFDNITVKNALESKMAEVIPYSRVPQMMKFYDKKKTDK